MKMFKYFSIAIATILLSSCGGSNTKNTPKISYSKPYFLENSHVVLVTGNKTLKFKKEVAIEKDFTSYLSNVLIKKLQQSKLSVESRNQSAIHLRIKVHYNMIYFALTNRKANPFVSYSIYVKKNGHVIDQYHSGSFTITRGIFRKKSIMYEHNFLNQIATKIVERIQSM